MISYRPLWKYMEEHGITTYQLIQQGVDKRTIFNLKHNESVTMFTAEKICKIVGCCIADFVEFLDD